MANEYKEGYQKGYKNALRDIHNIIERMDRELRDIELVREEEFCPRCEDWFTKEHECFAQEEKGKKGEDEASKEEDEDKRRAAADDADSAAGRETFEEEEAK